ncbi:uncharacterized protein ACA1_198440 [Acanthamoeba castellanii str. Neff]|uniref:Gag1-like clamp domain-containing protein n=1 Tax=Acanthamoeba castellanii (strain ATCC 30010 / Neff) TaxID=1257118 RepID=L8H4I2_ACACF|nr:uncharacterized protein ACA1_198440 [Acanthamoeba castellanii str. Neff]ELR19623.1 hypothetical protein ACA1_198440 [Acanthamoeba castellanii str. Neff]
MEQQVEAQASCQGLPSGGTSAAGPREGWVNIGEQTWSALRHEWKYKSPNDKKGGTPQDSEKPKEKKRIDPDVIYTDVTSRGQLSQPVPLSDLVNVLTWVWETDSNW